MDTVTNTTGALLRSASARLQSHTETPVLEAQVLMAHVLGKERTWVMAHPETELSPSVVRNYQQLVQRLLQGEPLAYILQRREFFGLAFNVNPSVLIPRPETEHLVERALAWLADHPACRRAVDVCCGSGCIAVTLAVKVPHLHLWATDISGAALAVAQSNAKRHTVTEQITFLQADLLTGVTTHFDLICANPPYIPSADVPATGEPRLALDGGVDGMDVIRRLLEQAKSHLSSPGMLLMEIEARQGKPVLELARHIFPQAQITCHPDLAGWDRIIEINLARF